MSEHIAPRPALSAVTILGAPTPTGTPRPRAGTLPDTGMTHAEPMDGAPVAGLIMLGLSLGAYGLAAARSRGLLARPSR